MIVKERGKGKTIIITTHNMQDATELCDRVVFIVDGQMKALVTPHNFINGNVHNVKRNCYRLACCGDFLKQG